MRRVLVFVNQKGGVGKTTTCINLGAYLALAGKKVLLIDFDPQANLSSGLGANTEGRGIYEVITRHVSAEEAIQRTSIEGLDLIPATINLSGANVELVDQVDRDLFLKRSIAEIRASYDYVIIDCPPSLGVLTLNGLAAADQVVIPLQCEYFALEGLKLLLQTVKLVQKGLNQALTIGGIVFTMYDSRTRLAQDVVQQVTGYFKDKVFKTIIPRNVRLSEAPSHGKAICDYDPECAGAKSYERLAREVIERG
jgi:chromosome partitioning protein